MVDYSVIHLYDVKYVMWICNSGPVALTTLCRLLPHLISK